MTIVVITCAIVKCFFFSLQNAIVLSLFLPYLIVCKHTAAAAAESQTRRHLCRQEAFLQFIIISLFFFPEKREASGIFLLQYEAYRCMLRVTIQYEVNFLSAYLFLIKDHLKNDPRRVSFLFILPQRMRKRKWQTYKHLMERPILNQKQREEKRKKRLAFVYIVNAK